MRALALHDRQAALLEGGRRDRLHVTDAAVDVGRVLQDRAGPVGRRDDLRVVERDGVRDPLVVDVLALVTQQDVLDPVGGGQPVATPDSMPAHHGFSCRRRRWCSLRAMSSSHVCGICQLLSLNIFGEYHTKLFTFEPSGAP
jgi:hypothetical protein